MLPTCYIDLSENEQIVQLLNFLKSREMKEMQVNEEPSGDMIKDISHIIEATELIWKDTDCKDLEGIVNSIFSLMFSVPVTQVGVLVSKLSAVLAKGAEVEGKDSLSCKQLSYMFKLYPSENKFLYDVYCAWIKVSQVSRSVENLPFNLEKINTWVLKWELEEEKKHELYRLLYDAQYDCGEFSRASEVMVALLSCFDEQTAKQAQNDAIKCIQRCIKGEGTYVFDHLVELEPIKSLKGQPIYALLEIFVNGTVQDYLSFHQNNPAVLEEHGLDHDESVRKMRLLTLIDLIGTQRELSFDVVIEGLDIQDDELEEIFIDAVTSKLVRGRIDEVNRKLLVSQACKRRFGAEEWDVLYESLCKCSTQLNMFAQQLDCIVNA